MDLVPASNTCDFGTGSYGKANYQISVGSNTVKWCFTEIIDFVA
jgi:hypothetical protein